MYWAIGGFTAITLAGLGAVVVIIRRLNRFEREPLADHFPPPRDQ